MNWLTAHVRKYPIRMVLALLLPLAFVLGVLLAPPSPANIDFNPGPDLSGLEEGGKGELTDFDVTVIINQGGAAVDYPRFSDDTIEFEWSPTQNFGYNPAFVNCGPDGVNCLHGQNNPRAVVVHTAEGTCPGLKDWFSPRHNSQSSYAFAVCKDGSIIQFCEVEDACWHAGVRNLPSEKIDIFRDEDTGQLVNANLLSVGVGLEGKCSENKTIFDFPAQEASLRLLMGWIRDTVDAIKLDSEHIVGHFDIDGVSRSRDPLCRIPDFEGWIASLAPAPPPPPPPADLQEFLDRLAAIEAEQARAAAELAEINERLAALEDAAPGPGPTPSPTPAPSPGPQQCLYTVQPGDSLGLIALKELDDVNRWPEIAALNGLPPPYVIHVGQVLEVPCGT